MSAAAIRENSGNYKKPKLKFSFIAPLRCRKLEWMTEQRLVVGRVHTNDQGRSEELRQ
jgi:hypothetical protein